LLWHKTEPSGKLTAILKASSIPDSRNQGRRCHGTDALDFSDALAQFAGSIELSNTPIVGCNTLIQFSQLRAIAEFCG
jgi:hypothetical protein